MKISNIELIEKYVHKELSLEEEVLLKERLEQDAEFAEDFELAVHLNNLHRAKRREHYQHLLVQQRAEKEAKQQETPPKTVQKKRIFSFIKVLSGMAALLLILAIPFLLFTQSDSVNQLVEKELQQITQAIPAQGVRNVNDGTTWRLAMIAFAEEEDKTVIAILKKELKNEHLANRNEVHFYLGMAYLRNNNYSNSIEQFNQLLQLPDKQLFKEEATWYKSMALLKEGQEEQSKAFLEAIKPNEDHYEIAQKILKKMK